MSHRGYPGGHHTEVALLTGVAPEGVRVRRHSQHDLARSGGRLAAGRRDALPVPVAGRRRHRLVVESQGRQGAVRGAGHAGLQATVHRRHARRRWPARSSGSRPARASSTACATRRRSLAETLGPADRGRLDLMLTSIREAEQRLQQDQAWVQEAQAEGAGQAAHRRLPHRPADAGPRTPVVRPGPPGPANRFDARDRPVALVLRPRGLAGRRHRPSRRDAPRPGRGQDQAARA